MGKKFIFTLIMSLTVMVTLAQSKADWNRWIWLIGEWIGEGSGQSGQGSGTFTFKNDLDNHILVRKNHTEFPPAENKPKTVHDDLMIVYPDNSGNPANAIYFDNEGHTINYSISYTDSAIVLTSPKIPASPVFRLSYRPAGKNLVTIKFEISRDGENFMNYLEGKSKKIK